ncbi:hypothetical protein RI054_10g50780 [Pseudoscourfieldia marina]
MFQHRANANAHLPPRSHSSLDHNKHSHGDARAHSSLGFNENYAEHANRPARARPPNAGLGGTLKEQLNRIPHEQRQNEAKRKAAHAEKEYWSTQRKQLEQRMSSLDDRLNEARKQGVERVMAARQRAKEKAEAMARRDEKLPPIGSQNAKYQHAQHARPNSRGGGMYEANGGFGYPQHHQQQYPSHPERNGNLYGGHGGFGYGATQSRPSQQMPYGNNGSVYGTESRHRYTPPPPPPDQHQHFYNNGYGGGGGGGGHSSTPQYGNTRVSSGRHARESSISRRERELEEELWRVKAERDAIAADADKNHDQLRVALESAAQEMEAHVAKLSKEAAERYAQCTTRESRQAAEARLQAMAQENDMLKRRLQRGEADAKAAVAQMTTRASKKEALAHAAQMEAQARTAERAGMLLAGQLEAFKNAPPPSSAGGANAAAALRANKELEKALNEQAAEMKAMLDAEVSLRESQFTRRDGKRELEEELRRVKAERDAIAADVDANQEQLRSALEGAAQEMEAHVAKLSKEAAERYAQCTTRESRQAAEARLQAMAQENEVLKNRLVKEEEDAKSRAAQMTTRASKQEALAHAAQMEAQARAAERAGMLLAGQLEAFKAVPPPAFEPPKVQGSIDENAAAAAAQAAAAKAAEQLEEALNRQASEMKAMLDAEVSLRESQFTRRDGKTKLTSQLDTLKNENEALIARLRKAEDKEETMMRQMTSRDTKDRLVSQLNEQTREMKTKLDAEISLRESQFTRRDGKTKLTAELDTLKNENEALIARLRKAEDKEETMMRQMTSRDTKDRLVSQVSELQRQNARLVSSENLRAQYTSRASKQQALQSAEQEKQRLEHKLSAADAELRRLRERPPRPNSGLGKIEEELVDAREKARRAVERETAMSERMAADLKRAREELANQRRLVVELERKAHDRHTPSPSPSPPPPPLQKTQATPSPPPQSSAGGLFGFFKKTPTKPPAPAPAPSGASPAPSPADAAKARDAARVKVLAQLTRAGAQQLTKMGDLIGLLQLYARLCLPALEARAMCQPGALASAETVEKAHRRAVVNCHPDRNVSKPVDEQVLCEELFKLLQSCRAVWNSRKMGNQRR